MAEARQRLDAIRRQFVKPPDQTLAQVALAYVLSNPDVSATIPGAGSPAEMRDNLSVNTFPLLPAGTVKDLTEAADGRRRLMRPKK
jgi:aryl-alcohol dehydrogenase-like predicted oxidoreductase